MTDSSTIQRELRALGDTDMARHSTRLFQTRPRKTQTRFLDRHYREMPRTMLRYAIEKLPPEIRQGYLRGRI